VIDIGYVSEAHRIEEDGVTEYVLRGDTGRARFSVPDVPAARRILEALAPLRAWVDAHDRAALVAAQSRVGHSVRVGEPRLSTRLASPEAQLRDANHYALAREMKW
jgi:hypothetical protein